MPVICPCDGCQKIFTSVLNLVNAKTWRASVCDKPETPPPGSGVCRRWDCRYNIEGACAEFYFCDACLCSPETLDRTFEEFNAC